MPARLTASKSVRTIQTADGAALLDLCQGICFSLNPLGAKIWNFLMLQWPPEEIAESIGREFALPTYKVRGDVLDFIGLLGQHGLLLPLIPSAT